MSAPNEPDWERASGACLCAQCGERYDRHPHAEEYPSFDGHPWLRRLCNGRLVKL